MTDYDGQFLFPPRPERAIPSEALHVYEKRAWIAQTKKNGTNNVITVTPRGPDGKRSLICRKRTGENHELWRPTEASSAPFLALPGDGWYVFVAELMHSKVAGGEKDTNYLHDVLVADGEYLVGSTYAERRFKLMETFASFWAQPGEHPQDAVKLNDNTFILKSFGGDGLSFRDRFDALKGGADEGLVIKDPGARLRLCVSEKSNAHGMVKSRRGKRNLSF